MLPLAQVYAADITVDSTCTLAQAINEANEATTGTGSCEAGDDANPSANPPEDGADKIILPAQVASTSSSPRVVTTLSAALPWLASNITIEGQGHVINLSAGTSITVADGAQVTIKDLTISGGGSFYYPQLYLVDNTTLINVSLVNATYMALRGANSYATFTLTNVFIGRVFGVFSLPAGLDALAGTWIITDLLIREIWGGGGVNLGQERNIGHPARLFQRGPHNPASV